MGGTSSMKPLDAAGPSAGLDTMAEDLDQLKYDVGELKDLLSHGKGEVNHIRRIVLACERDMEDFTAAMDAVNVDLDEMRARVDATHSIITSRQRVEATMTAEISTMRLDIGDIQEALKNHDSWMEDVSNTLQQMQEKEENLTEDIINLKNEMNTKLDTKVNEKPFEDLKHCVASLTKGVAKFAQVVGVFPGPRFDDAEGVDQREADVELLGWEECAENMSFRVDKAWRQRCSQRFRNILDMIAKKADHSVLRLLQISQQHIESQLERVKHERELWKEVVERRQQQPLQLALSMKEQPADTLPAVGAPQSARALR